MLCLGITPQPPINLLRRRRIANPSVRVTLRPQRIAQPPNHVIHRAPAFHITSRKPPHLRLACLVLIPKLNTRPIQERHEQPIHRRRPLEPALHQVQLTSPRADAATPQGKRTATYTPPEMALQSCKPHPPAPRASSTSTRLPARARYAAHANPLCPAPTTITSHRRAASSRIVAGSPTLPNTAAVGELNAHHLEGSLRIHHTCSSSLGVTPAAAAIAAASVSAPTPSDEYALRAKS